MRYPITIAAVAIGLLICLFNYTGYDPHNVFLFMLSPPAWISDVFYDIHKTPVVAMYMLTIISYAIVGYACDRLIAAGRKRSRA